MASLVSSLSLRQVNREAVSTSADVHTTSEYPKPEFSLCARGIIYVLPVHFHAINEDNPCQGSYRAGKPEGDTTGEMTKSLLQPVVCEWEE
jgi:hypothetical protein